MKFFNRFSILYSLIVFVLTLTHYLVATKYFLGKTGHVILWWLVLYIVIIFASALVINQKDKSENYAGFKYHLLTYVIANFTPLILAISGVIERATIGIVIGTMIFWGIGLLFHWGMYYFMFRKKKIGNYEKEDIFS